MADGDAESYEALKRQGENVLLNRDRQGYWRSLRTLAQNSGSPFIVTLANDLLPGCGWLKRALDAHRLTFGDTGEGLIGFNDGVHFGELAAHFLINRSLLYRWYGDDYFPVMYDHTWGDAEITRRAEEEGKFATANFSIMFHNHPYNGRQTDTVYSEGQLLTDTDHDLFYRRLNSRWTSS